MFYDEKGDVPRRHIPFCQDDGIFYIPAAAVPPIAPSNALAMAMITLIKVCHPFFVNFPIFLVVYVNF